jgi:hypothetical protein
VYTVKKERKTPFLTEKMELFSLVVVERSVSNPETNGIIMD